MNFFWLMMGLSGVFQLIGCLAGYYMGIDIKFLWQFAVYGTLNVIIGYLGL